VKGIPRLTLDAGTPRKLRATCRFGEIDSELSKLVLGDKAALDIRTERAFE